MSEPLSPPAYVPLQPQPIEVPDYLRMHWFFVLLICGVFNQLLGNGIGTSSWLLLQSRWVRQVTGESKAYKHALITAVLFVLMYADGFLVDAFWTNKNARPEGAAAALGCAMLGMFIVGVIFYLLAAFAFRRELESAPFGMKLSGVMTFFFGPIYFQYQFRKWARPGELGGSQIVAATPPSKT